MSKIDESSLLSNGKEVSDTLFSVSFLLKRLGKSFSITGNTIVGEELLIFSEKLEDCANKVSEIERFFISEATKNAWEHSVNVFEGVMAGITLAEKEKIK